ncbi:uncharacterized protein JCM15063_005414 [Sporobolomyces koalae]|uniref:uncharacterized protein n=1 Tax=Sporobolomyces koalae TaxID=500713 RepID=UPI00316F1ADA
MSPPTSSRVQARTDTRSSSQILEPAAQPLLPQSHAYESANTAIRASSTRSKSFSSSTTKRRRTHLSICLALVGIVILSVGFWDHETAEIDSQDGTRNSRLLEWREWAQRQSLGVTKMHLGWGWNGTDEEDIVPVDRPESTKDNLDIAEEPAQGERIPFADAKPAETIEQDAVQQSTSVQTMNVRPFDRPPSRDPSIKYLSFENHSGFHNQRKSLVNALVLAKLLNRTLLLPPARLGNAIPWGAGTDLTDKVVFSEECKAGQHPDLPVARSTNSHLIAERKECDDPHKWTYVGWSWLINPQLFKDRQLVDRWNSSHSWFQLELEHGGLGLSPEDVHVFADEERRSYQIYDSRQTPTQLGLFQSRIDLDDLLEGPIAQKRLLQFGSLFSGSRLNLANEENQRDYEKTFNGVVIENEGLDAISDAVKERLGSYVAKNARQNMVSIFRKLTHNVLGIKAREIDRMIAESADKNARTVRRNPTSATTPALWQDDVEESFIEIVNPIQGFSRRQLEPRARKGQPSQPLSTSLHCRKALWPANDKVLSRLNTPLYIATDARSPTTEPSLRLFFDWFPCAFVLSDFTEATPGVSDSAVPALARLAAGTEAEWISDFDRSEMAKFLYPFLEAEIAARGVETIGTPQSTYSGYTAGILHQYYEAQGMVAPWNNT